VTDAPRRWPARTQQSAATYCFRPHFALLSFILGSVKKPNDSSVFGNLVCWLQARVHHRFVSIRTRPSGQTAATSCNCATRWPSTLSSPHLPSLRIFDDIVIGTVGHFQGNHFHRGRHDDSLIQRIALIQWPTGFGCMPAYCQITQPIITSRRFPAAIIDILTQGKSFWGEYSYSCLMSRGESSCLAPLVIAFS
jgi:hypothetical protein